MSKELVISANRHETKVAILEEDQLVEIYFQRANEYSLAGSIHKGRVTRVLPGMQSAFVDLGLERDTFLYVSDFFEENEEYDRILPTDKPERSPRGRVEPANEPRVERVAVLESVVVERVPSEAVPVVPFLEAAEPVFEAENSPEQHVVAAAAGSAGPEAQQRPDDAGERERRGRRSRRRRNRGRGFPDSKYASEAAEPAKTVEAVSQPEHSEPLRVEEFPVLPGESLAKYSRPASELDAADENEPAEPTELSAEHTAATGETVTHAPVVAEPVTPEPVTPEPVAAVEQHATPAPLSEPEPEPQPEAEAFAAIVAEEREGGAFTPEEVADSQNPGVEMLEVDEFDAVNVPEEDEEEPDGGEESAEEEELVSETPLAAEIGAGAAPTSTEGAAAPLTAHVREQGGRYMHRQGGRRMRRKGRGGQQQQGEPSSAVPANLVPRPDAPPQRAEFQRTVARPEKSLTPSITELLKEGQEIIVQIAKEPLGQKGARITSHIALPGRYVVYMPTLEHMGVSRKIASDDERLRLKKILQGHRGEFQGGFIVRTAGEGKSEEEISADMNFLSNLWLDIRHKAEKKPAPLLLHHDLDIVQRILRDQVSDTFKSIWVDSEEVYESILRFVQRFQPALVTKVKLYTRSGPIFDAFNITAELEKALRPKVWLKSGGYIVINQTEALVAIDINTGKYVGKSNRLEDTIVKTNTEAVKEIVRQIRLRDLGGIIVVDFIDMDERRNRAKVMQALEEAMRADKAPYKILQFNDFGLVAITRKRVKQSLERTLCSPCPYCEGAGYVKSVQTTVSDILQEAHKIAKAVEGKDVMLRVHPDVAKFLKSNQNKYLEEMEEVLRRPVLVKGDPTLHQEKFDLA
jgi:ribonuclease G